jgi:hypothetical protein
MDYNFTPKNAKKFYCQQCDFKCCKQSDFDRHKSTSKHKKDDAELHLDDAKNAAPCACYICECGKKYRHRQGLWKHKKNCKIETNTDNLKEPNEIKILTNLVMDVIKQNNDLTHKIFDICKNNSSTINTINSNNKTFNLQFFLNETCKDAMNIMEFVESIQLQLSDLERLGEIGFVEGISNIIVKNLKQLDITQRPVHCTDKKREVLYIKDENKWEKEDEEKKKIRKIIKKVANKNIRMLQKFKEEHPDCGKSESKFSDQYNKLIVESMGGSGDNDIEKENKIIKNITKEVTIEK